MTNVKPTRLFLLTLLAMIAFASNSLLCRVALRNTTIDAATFTLIRITSGAAALLIIVRLRRSGWSKGGNWLSAFALFTYAAAFSFAYINLSAGTGALLLFGTVQAAMILWGISKGERVRAIQVAGLLLAMAGLIILVFPGLTSPPLVASILMFTAGLAWGVYSVRGKGESRPIEATAGNFLRAVPFAISISVLFLRSTHFDSLGAWFALLSGAITSGLGYVVWYTILPALKATSAAAVQLSVPVLVAIGGILLLGESLTLRLVLASVTILGGIALVVFEKNARA